VNSDSENDHYDDFDPKNPFGDDEIEQFHNDKDKVNCSPNRIYIYKNTSINKNWNTYRSF
jgi:hypothetical protein